MPVVNGFVGCPNWGAWYPEPPPYEEIYTSFFNIFAEKWNDILDYFGSNGVKYAFEVHPAQVAYNIETAELALDSIKWRKEFGFNFDPSHLVWQLVDPVLFIKKFGKKILPLPREGRGISGREFTDIGRDIARFSLEVYARI